MGAVGLGQGNCRREEWLKEYEEVLIYPSESTPSEKDGCD